MSASAKPVQEAAIQQYAKQLRLPTLGGQFARLAGEAVKERQSHLSYLEYQVTLLPKTRTKAQSLRSRVCHHAWA